MLDSVDELVERTYCNNELCYSNVGIDFLKKKLFFNKIKYKISKNEYIDILSDKSSEVLSLINDSKTLEKFVGDMTSTCVLIFSETEFLVLFYENSSTVYYFLYDKIKVNPEQDLLSFNVSNQIENIVQIYNCRKLVDGIIENLIIVFGNDANENAKIIIYKPCIDVSDGYNKKIKYEIVGKPIYMKNENLFYAFPFNENCYENDTFLFVTSLSIEKKYYILKDKQVLDIKHVNDMTSSRSYIKRILNFCEQRKRISHLTEEIRKKQREFASKKAGKLELDKYVYIYSHFQYIPIELRTNEEN